MTRRTIVRPAAIRVFLLAQAFFGIPKLIRMAELAFSSPLATQEAKHHHQETPESWQLHLQDLRACEASIPRQPQHATRGRPECRCSAGPWPSFLRIWRSRSLGALQAHRRTGSPRGDAKSIHGQILRRDENGTLCRAARASLLREADTASRARAELCAGASRGRCSSP